MYNLRITTLTNLIEIQLKVFKWLKIINSSNLGGIYVFTHWRRCSSSY